MAASNNNFLPFTEIPCQEGELLSSFETDQNATLRDTMWMNTWRRYKDTINSPDRENLVHHFKTDGYFHELLMHFATADGGKPQTRDSDKHAVCLGTLGMELGLAIEIEELKIIHSALKRMDLPQKDKERLEKALENYKRNEGSWECKPPHSTSVPIHGCSGLVKEAKEEDQPFQTLLKDYEIYLAEKWEEKVM